MQIKIVFSSLVILELAKEVWSHIEDESEDYFFPLEPVIKFCTMSEQCKHDFIPVCGQDTLGITKIFIDYCDMYEYNCDDKKQYRHVKMNVCHYVPIAADTYLK